MDSALLAKLETGKLCVCPTCDQTVKVYPRRVHAKMLKGLQILSTFPDGLTHKEWIKHITWSGDYAKLSYWGLIERNKSTKVWHVTERGHAFLRGELKIPTFANVYNKAVRWFSGPEIDVYECRAHFDLDELMNPNTITNKGVSR